VREAAHAGLRGPQMRGRPGSRRLQGALERPRVERLPRGGSAQGRAARLSGARSRGAGWRGALSGGGVGRGAQRQ